MSSQSYFSIQFDLIKVGKPTTYDLYVNSSAVEDKEKFIRIFPSGETLTQEDLEGFKEKYIQLRNSVDEVKEQILKSNT